MHTPAAPVDCRLPLSPPSCHAHRLPRWLPCSSVAPTLQSTSPAPPVSCSIAAALAPPSHRVAGAITCAIMAFLAPMPPSLAAAPAQRGGTPALPVRAPAVCPTGAPGRQRTVVVAVARATDLPRRELLAVAAAAALGVSLQPAGIARAAEVAVANPKSLDEPLTSLVQVRCGVDSGARVHGCCGSVGRHWSRTVVVVGDAGTLSLTDCHVECRHIHFLVSVGLLLPFSWPPLPAPSVERPCPPFVAT